MNTDKQNSILNHTRIGQLLARGDKRLQEIFRKRWIIYKNTDWRDEDGKELISLCDTPLPGVKDALTYQSIDSWDITAASYGIKIISTEIQKHGFTANSEEDKNIALLRKFRNGFSHGKNEYSNDEFNNKWNEVAKYLVDLGDNYADIEKLKADLMDLGKHKVEDVVETGADKMLKESAPVPTVATDVEENDNNLLQDHLQCHTRKKFLWKPEKEIYTNPVALGTTVKKITFFESSAEFTFTNNQMASASDYRSLPKLLQNYKPADELLLLSMMTRFTMHRDFLKGSFNDFAGFWEPNKSVTICGNWCSDPLTALVSTFPKQFRQFRMQDFTIHVAGRLHWLFPEKLRNTRHRPSHLLELEELLFDCRLTDNKNYYPNVWHITNYFHYGKLKRIFLNVQNFCTAEMAEKSFELLDQATCTGATVTVLMDQYIDNQLFQWMSGWGFKYVGETYCHDALDRVISPYQRIIWSYCTFNATVNDRLFTYCFRYKQTKTTGSKFTPVPLHCYKTTE